MGAVLACASLRKLCKEDKKTGPEDAGKGFDGISRAQLDHTGKEPGVVEPLGKKANGDYGVDAQGEEPDLTIAQLMSYKNADEYFTEEQNKYYKERYATEKLQVDQVGHIK